MKYATYKKVIKSRKPKPQKRHRLSKPKRRFWLLNMFEPWLPYCLIVLLLALGVKVWMMLQSPVSFPLAHVEVEATYKHLSRARLRQAVGSAIHGGFFSFNVDALKSQLRSELPWLKSVSVRRIWPNRLKLIITERKAVAVWNGRGLVTRKGLLFSPPVDEFPKGLVALEGPSESLGGVLSEYFQMSAQLQKVGLYIVGLEMTARGAWHLRLRNGMRLLLGRQNISMRLARFVRAYARVIGDSANKVRSVDLRYPNGFAVAWQSGKPPL